MQSLKDLFHKSIIDHSLLLDKIDSDHDFIESLNSACDLIINAFKNGNKVILAGNGGSAADAQHIAAEFVSRFRFNRPGLPALSLSVDPSIITAISNDYGYDRLFDRQLRTIGNSGDIFIGISTSGKSQNVITAIQACREIDITSIGLTGQNRFLETDISLIVPSLDTPRIQEIHICIGHIICEYVEFSMFS